MVELSLSDQVWLYGTVRWKAWSSLVVAPASGEASSDSRSESRVHSSGGSGTGIES